MIGFGNATVQNRTKILENLKQYFRPEFLNRIDEIVVFDALTKEQLLQIVDLMLSKTQLVLSNKNITITVTKEAKEFLLDKGTDLAYGARPLRRAIQRYIEDELSDRILKSELRDGQKVEITFDSENSQLAFHITD